MTPQELKYSILSLAIKGKLVPQIQSVSETITKKSLEKSPFEIPNTWRWERLGKCCELYTGNSISESEKKSKYEGLKEGYEYIATKDVSYNHHIDYENGVRIPFSTDFKIAKANSVLMCVEGGSAGRKIAVLERDVCFGNKLCMLRSESIFSKYLFFFLQSFEFRTEFMEKMTGIIGGVSLKNLKEILLPVPPHKEQLAIVSKIEELVPLIEQYEKAYNRLEQLNKQFPDDMKKSILQLAIQGKLVEQRPEEGTGEELYKQIQAEKARLIKEGKIKKEKPLPPITEDQIPFEIPSSWFWVRFGMLGSYKKGPFGSALTKSMFVPKGPNSVKVYEQKNAIQKDASLGDYYISRTYFESKMKGFEVHTGDIIVSCAGTIGETYVLPECIEQGIINQALMRMKIYEPMFIPYFLMFFDVVLKQTAQVGSKGSAIKNIPPFEILNNYLVPIPPLAEQKRIVAKIEELLPLCDLLKGK